MNKKTVAETHENLPSAEDIDEFLNANRGAGISNRPEDVITPSITCVNPGDAGKVEGSKAGDFLVGERIVAPTPGLWFQVCGVRQLFLEFRPLDQGGGFVAAYPFTGTDGSQPIPPEGAVARDKNPNRLTFPNGNACMHYRQVVGFLFENQIGLEYIVPFKSSGHTAFRKWNAEIGRVTRLPNGSQDPVYSHVWLLTTEKNSNQMGTWYLPKPVKSVSLRDPQVEKIVGPNRLAVLQMAKALNESFEGRALPTMLADRDDRGDEGSAADSRM